MTKQTVRTTTQVRTETLTPLEEKVVRMRHGLGAPETLELGMQAQGNAELAAKLADMERRALAHGARVEPDAKSRIVSALRKKSRS